MTDLREDAGEPVFSASSDVFNGIPETVESAVAENVDLREEVFRLREALNRRSEPLSEVWLTKLHDRAHAQPNNRTWRIVDTLVHQVDRLTLENAELRKAASAASSVDKDLHLFIGDVHGFYCLACGLPPGNRRHVEKTS